MKSDLRNEPQHLGRLLKPTEPGTAHRIEVSLLTGGGDKPYAFGLATELIRWGVALELIGSDDLDCPEFHEKSQVRFLNLRGDQRPDASFMKKIQRVLAYYVKLIRYAAMAKPKIFHLLWNNKFQSFDRTVLMLYYKLLGKKIVLTVHNVNAAKRDSRDSFFNRLTLRVQYRLSDHLFVHTEKMKHELVEEFGAEGVRVTVVPFGINNAVPNTSLSSEEARQRLGIRDNQKTILFFGNIAPYKGLEYLVMAFRQIVDRDGEYRLVIAGRPKNGERYWAAIHTSIRDDIEQGRILLEADYIPDNEAEVYFKAADVLVLPYTHIYQSGVLFLGHSFGLPVLVADVGSLKDQIVEGKTGFVFRSQDPSDLARTIERYFMSDLFTNLDARREGIRNYAAEQHSWDVVGRITTDVYTELLRSPLAGEPATSESSKVPRSRALLDQAEHDLELSSKLVQHQSAGPSLEALPSGARAVTPEKETYGQILKSSALVGGSSVANIAIGIVRTKAMAVLLGPAGYGLFGLYGSIANLIQSIAGMGVNSSGVRQIAAAVGSGDAERVALTTIVLRRTSIVLGALGALFLVMFAQKVSIVTFGNNQHAADVCLLSAAVFFQLISWGQDALIQGMRRIADLAKMQVLGALLGMILSVTLVYFAREKGVVPSLVSVALMYLAVSWWFSRKVRIQTPSIAFSHVAREAAALLKLGSVFMATGFMTTGVAYAVRIMVLHKVGYAATGYYQSAWTLGGLYVGFILQAMAADFYPRLTAIAHDDTVCNRLVNEQTQVGLLLAGPGVIATLTFTPLVIGLFYSAKFLAAGPVLRWICLGTTLQVITWPMGFIIVAKGRQAVFFATELAWTVASLGLAWVCVTYVGLSGAGIAFFGSYVLYGILLYPVVNRLSGFHWSAANQRIGLLFLSLITLVFCGFYVLPLPFAACLGAFATLLSGVYSIRVLSRFVSWDLLPRPIRRLIVQLWPIPSRFTKI